MAKTLEKLLALAPEIEEELADEGRHSPLVRTPLLNILGALSQLRDGVRTDKHLERD